EQRLEIAEVSPQRSQGHPRPRGDLRPCGFELSRPDERDMSFYDGLPGALCASAPAVRRDRRLVAVLSFRVHRSPDFRSDSPPDRSLPSSVTGITFLMANNSRHSRGIVIPLRKLSYLRISSGRMQGLLGEQSLRDMCYLNFVTTGVDHQRFRIARELFDAIFGHVSVSPEQLHG